MDEPPPLPPGAPAELVDFVGCRRQHIELRDGKLRWLPSPPGLPRRFGSLLAPTLRVGPGPGPSAGALAVGWGPVRLRLRAVVVDGVLEVAPEGGAPPGLGEVVAGIGRWVTHLNGWFERNGLELAPITARPAQLSLCTQPRR